MPRAVDRSGNTTFLRSRSAPTVGVGLALLSALTAGCTRTEHLPLHPQPLPAAANPASSAATARPAAESRQLPEGPLASAEPEAFVLENGRATFVIARLGSPHGGALVDASLAALRSDSLRSLSPVVGEKALRPPLFDRLDLREDSDRGEATVRLQGHDPGNPQIAVTSEYTLRRDSPLLEISTTVVNRGADPIKTYRLGDAIDWGVGLPFVPGFGHAPPARARPTWLAAWSPTVAYAYFRQDGAAIPCEGADKRWTATLRTARLSPDQEVRVHRLFAVGRGGQLADLLTVVAKSQGISSGHLEVTVTTDLGDPSAGTRLELSRGGSLVTIARTGDDGKAVLTLPTGHYEVRARAPDRASDPARVRIRPGRSSSLELATGPPSRLIFDVREHGSEQDFPVKLTIIGLAGTPTPWLGPGHSRRAGNTLLSPTGKGLLPLPPGRYRVIASHGPQYSIHLQEIALRPHSGGSLTTRLRREVTPPGYLGIDLGQQTLRSPGSAVSLEDRVLSSRAEGLDGAVVTRPVPPEQQARCGEAAAGPLLLARGLAYRSPTLGRMTLLPDAKSWRTADGPLEQLLTAAPASERLFVQLDEGRSPASGLFTRLAFDAERPDPALLPDAIDAIRVLDRRHAGDFDRLLQDWLALLRTGRHVVATGASDSLTILGGEAGFPRTYVRLPQPDRPACRQLVAALTRGQAVVSSGPFVDLAVNGRGPGEMATATRRPGAPGELVVEVTVSAPRWISLTELALYLGGRPWGKPTPLGGSPRGSPLRQTFRIPTPARDTFVVALARGSGSLAPVLSPTGPVLPPLALTNPVWIDVDGNGRYDP